MKTRTAFLRSAVPVSVGVRSFYPNFVFPEPLLRFWDSPSEEIQVTFTEKSLHYQTVSPSAPLISSSGAFFHHSSGIVTGNRPRVSNFPNSAFASARIEGSRILYAQR